MTQRISIAGIVTVLCITLTAALFALGMHRTSAQLQGQQPSRPQAAQQNQSGPAADGEEGDCVGKSYGHPGCPVRKPQTSSASPLCGNAVLNDGEECDFGKNKNGISNCTAACLLLYCGDGVVSPGSGEECEPEREERYVRNPDTGELEVEQRFLQSTCGGICTVPVCDEEGNCSGGCRRTFLPACTGKEGATASAAGAQGRQSSVARAGTPQCGDGSVQAGEECDDRNSVNTDACTDACRLPVCGDGIGQSGEQCDDGNDVDGDGCSNDCRLSACGDGSVQDGEECDDGNQANNDACTNACKSPRCGDGMLQGNEECDDGNEKETDACTNACTKPRCGDAVRQTGEECDDGNDEDKDACTTKCKAPRCGDGVVQGQEECDDGNRAPADGCSNLCTLPACGNGVKEGGEQCDDGNRLDGDSCTNECTLPRCGDGILQAGEECDDGNQVHEDACTNTCRVLRCGDGILQAGEECDDGRDNSNTQADACRRNCRSPRCGDKVIDTGEECDGYEGCTPECTKAHPAAASSGAFTGGIAFIGVMVLLLAGGGAFLLLRGRHRTLRSVARRGRASIDDIPLDEIEMPWHRW